MRVEHDPAPDRHGRRVRPEDEPVAPREHRGRLEPNPREGSGAGRHAVRRLPGEQRHACEQFGGALVEAHPRAVFQRPCARKQFHARVDHPRRLEQVRRHERLPTRHLLHLHASQVHGRPLASDDLLPAFTVHLQAAQLDRAVARQQQELVILADATGHEGAGHDRAKAFHREGAVDRQSRRTVDGSGHGLTRDSDERAAQRVEPLPGARRHRDHHRGFERCSLQKVGHLQANQLHGLVVHEVRLRERHDAPGHAEQPADLEVLAGLRHDGLVSRHHQQHGIDAARTGEHVAHEPFVPGHVDERDVHVAARPVREAEIDGDPARLLFLQAIGVSARERPDEAALPVVDVTGGADDDALHRMPVTAAGATARPFAWRVPVCRGGS